MYSEYENIIIEWAENNVQLFDYQKTLLVPLTNNEKIEIQNKRKMVYVDEI